MKTKILIFTLMILFSAAAFCQTTAFGQTEATQTDLPPAEDSKADANPAEFAPVKPGPAETDLTEKSPADFRDGAHGLKSGYFRPSKLPQDAPRFFTPNHQKIYAVDCAEYKLLCAIYALEGMAPPSSAGPWSEDELLFMLEKADRTGLPEEALPLRNQLFNTLTDRRNQRAAAANIAVAVEATAHTNTDSYFQGFDNFGLNFSDRKPLLNINLEFRTTPYFYIYGDLMLGINYYSLEPFGSSNFTTNIPGVAPNTLSDIDVNFPPRDFFSTGSKGWNLQIGKEKLNWGTAQTGNLLLDGHFQYHNMIRFASWQDNFKFSFVSSFFPHPMNYYSGDAGTGSTWDPTQGQGTPVTGLSMLLAHRFEFTPFRGKLKIALNEAIIYMSEENKLDISVFNPAMLYHNLYIRGNANSLSTLEMDFSPYKGWNVYGQLAVDEAVFFNEPDGTTTTPANPAATGIILGTKNTRILKGGILSVGLEGAFTDPYLYLRANGITGGSQKKNEYGVNYVAALRIMNAAKGLYYYEDYIGYPYGGDAITANLNAEFTVPEKWNLSANFLFMAHGTFDRWTCWSIIGGENKIKPSKTPTTSHTGDNQKDDEADLRNAVCYTYDAGLKGSVNITPSLLIYGQTDAVFLVNPDNRAENGSAFDYQITLGIEWKPLPKKAAVRCAAY